MSAPALVTPGHGVPASPRAAIASCLASRASGVSFPAGECQMRTRLAYGVQTDGTPTAVDGWHRSTHRVGSQEWQRAPYGALHRWSGGSEGDGHVAISAARGTCLTVDIYGGGWWRASVPAIARWAPRLVYLGWTLDIDGVVVVGPDRQR